MSEHTNQPDNSLNASNLPALVSSTATVLRRTQTTLGLLREVVQESSADYWYERGKEASTRGNWSNAFHYLKKCLNLSPTHWQGLLRLAVTELNLFGNFIANNAASAVIKSYNSAWINRQEMKDELLLAEWDIIFKNIKIELEYGDFESSATALAILHWLNNSKNKLRETLDSIAKVTISIETFGVWHRLSGTYWQELNASGEAKKKLMQKAMQSFGYAIEVNAANPLIWLSRGNVKLYLQDNQGAINDYAKAIEILPQSVDAFIGRGQARNSLKLYNDAISDFDKAIDIEPNNAWSYWLRAKIKFGNEDFKGCIEEN